MNKVEAQIVKRPSIDPVTVANNANQALYKNCRQWREYATALEEDVRNLSERVVALDSKSEEQQPEIPEVPQFVADWYEENKGSLDYMIFETCRDLTDESTDEFENWFGYDENKAITTLVNMKNGYTVAKEKRFYLKHIEMSKHNETRDYWFSKKNYQHVHTDKGILPRNFGYLMGYGIGYLQFTQQEIDSMAADSYEQIEVEETENLIRGGK